MERKPRKRTGKYAAVIDKLPLTFNTEGNYQQRIDRMVDSLRVAAAAAQAALDSNTLANMYVEVVQEGEVIEAELHEVNLKLKAIEQMLFKEYEAVGTNMVKLTDGSSVQAYPEPMIVVKDAEKFNAWCLANGYQSKMSLHWQTRDAIAKERLLEGEPEPDGLEIMARPKIVYKAAPKGE